MLTPVPQDLRIALARYADARIEDARRSTDATARAVEDATYTLCVMTGTREIAQALRVADTLLGVHPEDVPAGRAHPGPQQDDSLQTA
ncbi:DUF5133 domain-containing protein [Streptomyces argenteolus]|uniref:DUF5133 domain-containing protein n=1 Tax=Streptomyces argenteolus TaxID=67274 RepID=A0ABW6X823_9ACTN